MPREPEKSNPMRCLHCGYSLRGIPADHCCPECGTPRWVRDPQIPARRAYIGAWTIFWTAVAINFGLICIGPDWPHRSAWRFSYIWIVIAVAALLLAGVVFSTSRFFYKGWALVHGTILIGACALMIWLNAYLSDLFAASV